MNRATQNMRDFARLLIAHETKVSKISAKANATAFLAVEKLRPHLGNLMGNTGFRALLLRSLTLASEDVSWLGAVHLEADGSAGGLHELEQSVGPDEFFTGSLAVLATLLGLLAALIGEKLTLHLMHEVWPKLSPNDLNFSTSAENEKED